MLELMALPFRENALEPTISEKTVQFHYGKHHKAYVDKTNELILGTDFQDMSLEEIIKRAFESTDLQTLYNNAGQVYNHNIYWNSIGIGKRLSGEMNERILAHFGTKEALIQKLTDEAVKVFGSGWVWLVEDNDERFEVMTTRNGDTPIVLGFKPVFNIDVWEHAYYLDYQNRRKDYAEQFIVKLLEL